MVVTRISQVACKCSEKYSIPLDCGLSISSAYIPPANPNFYRGNPKVPRSKRTFPTEPGNETSEE